MWILIHIDGKAEHLFCFVFCKKLFNGCITQRFWHTFEHGFWKTCFPKNLTWENPFSRIQKRKINDFQCLESKFEKTYPRIKIKCSTTSILIIWKNIFGKSVFEKSKLKNVFPSGLRAIQSFETQFRFELGFTSSALLFRGRMHL